MEVTRSAAQSRSNVCSAWWIWPSVSATASLPAAVLYLRRPTQERLATSLPRLASLSLFYPSTASQRRPARRPSPAQARGQVCNCDQLGVAFGHVTEEQFRQKLAG